MPQREQQLLVAAHRHVGLPARALRRVATCRLVERRDPGRRARDGRHVVDVVEQVLVAQHLLGQLVVHRRVEVARHQQRRRVEREAARALAVGDERRDDLGDVAPHGHEVRAAGGRRPRSARRRGPCRTRPCAQPTRERRARTHQLSGTDGGRPRRLPVAPMSRRSADPRGARHTARGRLRRLRRAAVPELFEARGAARGRRCGERARRGHRRVGRRPVGARRDLHTSDRAVFSR